MYHKIKVLPTVGTGTTYLVSTYMHPEELHQKLMDKFSNEVGGMVSIQYLAEYPQNDLNLSEVGKLDRILII